MLDGARILVAERELPTDKTIADHLEAFGAQVVGQVTNAADALIAIVSRKPLHTVLLDLDLDEMAPLLRILAAHRLPGIIYTADPVPPDYIRGYPHVAVIQKPCPMHTLAATISEVCSRWRAVARAA